MKSKWWLELRAQHADARPLTTICYSREPQERRRDCIYELKIKILLYQKAFDIFLCTASSMLQYAHCSAACLSEKRNTTVLLENVESLGQFFSFRVFLLRYLAEILRNSEFEQLVTATCVDIYLRIVISRLVSDVLQYHHQIKMETV